MIDFFIAFICTVGAIFIFLASVGIMRMPDFYLRVSVATKGGSMGVGLILIASALYFGEFGITTRALAIIFFLLITAPVGAHLLGRVAYLSKVPLWKESIGDDLEGKYNRKTLGLKGKDEEE